MGELQRQELADGARRIVALDERGAQVGAATIEPGRPGQPAMIEVEAGPELAEGLIGAALTEAGPGAYLWDHENNEASRELVRGFGLVPIRALLQMRRRLAVPALADPVFPDGVAVRTYQGSRDDEQLLRVNNAAFDWHPEQGGWSLEKLRERLAQPWVDPAGIFFAVDAADRVLGFHWTKADPEESMGEVYVLGVDPASHGKGLGKALTLVGLRHLRDRALDEVELYVEQTNKPALATYERLGFTVHAEHIAYVRPEQ